MINLKEFYLVAIKKIPLLKYSLILVVTIIILAVVARVKLNNADVFFYAFAVLLLSFFCFLLSSFIRTNDPFVKKLYYLVITSIILVISLAVICFGTFIIWEKPNFYLRWFPKIESKLLTPKQNNKFQDIDSLAKTALKDSSSSINIFQQHSGKGDNIAGDKKVNQ